MLIIIQIAALLAWYLIPAFAVVPGWVIFLPGIAFLLIMGFTVLGIGATVFGALKGGR